MRVGIYNRWLPTLGGGERFTIDIARALAADGHTVELITHQPLDRATIGARLTLPLACLTLRAVPDSPGNARLTAVSVEYDLFINVSQGDLFPSRAARAILVVHFPGTLESYATAGAPSGHDSWRAPSIVRWLDGVYPPETDGRRWWVWTGARATVEVERRWPGAARTLLIQLADLRPPSVPPPTVRVFVDGVLAGERDDHWTRWRLTLPNPVRAGATCEVTIEATPWTLRACGLASDDRERGLPLRSVALLANRLEERLTARRESQPLRAIAPTERSRALVEQALDSYDLIAANSRFTQQWIQRRWNRESQVLYPAVDLQSFPPLPKRPLILSVGRFFAGAHNKKHLSMIAAFRDLCDRGLAGWEYHLAGGCDLDQPEQRAYLESVRAAAEGYPIRLRVNLSSDELRRLYGEAAIFWHATGYGEDESRDPDSFEHFGITTIEAMAAGCVPVVIAKAGQLETVTHEQSGLLWHTLDELEVHTRRLIDDAALRERLSAGAMSRSRDFGMDVFAWRVRALVEHGNKGTSEQGNKSDDQ